ncbi:MAG: response regulator [Pseudomonadota bacterium]
MALLKALVVDNDKIIVELLAGILEGEGYGVEKAYGGLEALIKLKEQKFDIVFLDLIMPRVGGDRICKFIMQAPEHAGTKVVIVSAIAIEAEQKISELKAHACVAKAAYPKMKANILKVLSLLTDANHTSDNTILGSEGVHPRQVVSELIFAQRHFEAILNSMREAVIELDISHTVTYVNPSAQTLLGKQEWEIIGRNFIDGLAPDKAKEVLVVLDSFSRTTCSKAQDLLLKDSDREYSLSFRNVIRDGEFIGTTVVVNDLTEKKMLERERNLRERLTGVVEMAGAAAHELNQPLTVISGHAELLLKEAGSTNEKLAKRIAIILEQVERLGNLTRKFTSIVAYETKDCGCNIKIVDIDKASRNDDMLRLKGLWD